MLKWDNGEKQNLKKVKVSVDTLSMDKILEALEAYEERGVDEAQKSQALLKAFTEAHRKYNQMAMNLSRDLANENWEEACLKARTELEAVVAEIEAL